MKFLLITLTLGLVLPSFVSAKSVDYKSILKEWTRKDEAYNWTNLEARLVWSATYLSEDFRQAKLKKYGEIYELDPVEVQRLYEKERAEDSEYDSFFVSIYAGSREYPEIGKNRELWRLVLQVPGRPPLEPALWQEVTIDPVIRTLYPYIDRWSKSFIVRFPKVTSPATEKFELRMIGVPADSDLVWKLQKSKKHAQR